MSIKKNYLKTKPVCKVQFKLSKDEAKSAKAVNIVGEFNQWDTNATPLKMQKDGSFAVTIDLQTGKEYQFRYLLDKVIWETDFSADKFVETPFPNSENSIVVIESRNS